MRQPANLAQSTLSMNNDLWLRRSNGYGLFRA